MFALKLAWRDSRGARRRLLLFVSAMALGVAALVAIRSFGDNVDAALESKSRELFGADVAFQSNQRFSDRAGVFVDSLAALYDAETTREVTLASMALFPEADDGEGATRLVQILGLQGRFPFYGRFVTTPADAPQRFQAEGTALVDAALMEAFALAVGDSIRVGRRGYRIGGRVEQVTGQPDVAALVGPRVYLPLDSLDAALLDTGTRAQHTVYLGLPGGLQADAQAQAIAAALDADPRNLGLRVDTAAEVEGDWGEALGGLGRFLSLVGFVALLLGGIGVASAVSLYIRQKAESVATLRCLGASAGRVLRVYALQAAALGLVAAVLGAGLGVAVQGLLKTVFASFLPVEVGSAVSWRAVLEGLGIGVAAALGFALLPLVAVRHIPPLRALRTDDTTRARPAWRDPLRLLIAALLGAGVVGFAYLQTGNLVGAVGFAAGTAIALLLLTGVAVLLRALVRKLLPRAWPYPERQGLANLYRPGNQTLVLLLTLGLGTFLVMTLAVSQRSLLATLAVPEEGAGPRPDVVLFDIQADQAAGVDSLVRAEGFPVLGQVPIVSMRIEALEGRPADTLRADTTAGVERWALGREYRSTFRGELVDSEELLQGTFVGELDAPFTPETVVPISIEEEIAGDLGLRIGSRITWDVSGLPIESEVTSIRRVDWARIQPNFFVVFPEGVLEEAPRFGLLLTRAGSPEASARLQRSVVAAYPNVSAVDVQLVLGVIEEVLAEVALVLRFMAAFSILTGLVVLMGSVLAARAQRVRESVLLRTIGANRGQVRRVLLAEYALLGLLAAGAGVVLALGGGWALARFELEVPFVPDWGWLIGALVVTPLATIAVGLAGSRGLLARPPLEVLREADA